ncbi:unnamed protein product, partial [Adineta steineri]
MLKKSLSEKYTLKLKDTELEFVVAGIDISANLGLLDVKDIFYGRQTIREETVSKFDPYKHQIHSLLEEPIKYHCIAATGDLSTDDLMKRSYLNFTVSYVINIYELKHTLLR